MKYLLLPVICLFAAVPLPAQRMASTATSVNCGPSTGDHDDCTCWFYADNPSEYVKCDKASGGANAKKCFTLSDCSNSTAAGAYNFSSPVNIHYLSGSDTITVNADDVHQYFEFQMQYPHHRVTYFVSNIRHEGSRVGYDSYKQHEFITTWDEEMLKDSTRTQSFTVYTGDSISLYREFRWWNTTTDSQTVNNYVALDTLDYVIEVINANTNNRLALIDSLGALRQLSAGSPPLYGTEPIIAEINYIVPSSMNGIPIRIRIAPHARGTGAQKFSRYDSWGANIDQRAHQSWTASYLSLYGGGLLKRVLPLEQSSLATVQVSPNPSSGTFTVTAQEIGEGSAIIYVYNEQGKKVAFETKTKKPTIHSGESVEVSINESGAYFITLQRGEKVIAQQKVVVEQ